MAGRQGREELIKKGLLEMMERGKWGPEARRRRNGYRGAQSPGAGAGPQRGLPRGRSLSGPS